jgi:uncharacterized iron-regulated membrane protein
MLSEQSTRERKLRRWPRIPARVVEATLAGHSTLGLAAAALIYIVCLSGAVSVFAREIEQWETPRIPARAEAAPEAMVAAIEAALPLARAEGEPGAVMAFGPEPGMPRLRIRAVGEDYARVWAADADGSLTPMETPVSLFIRELHGNLHSPGWGLYAVGVSGVALLSLLFTGFFSHPRIFRDAFRFRRGGAWRLQEADLHNRLSVWGAPFHLIVAFTGAVIGLGPAAAFVIGLAQTRGEPGGAAAAEIHGGAAAALSFDAIARAARAIEDAGPRSAVRFILVLRPETEEQSAFVDVVSPDHLASGESYAIGADGTTFTPAGLFDGGAATQLQAAMIPLHYGTFGGPLIKIVYGLLGLALAAVVSTGVSIWMARRRDRGRPAPRLERLWTGFAWGQVSALAAAAITGDGYLMAVYLAVSLLAAASFVAPADTRRFAAAHRAIAGVLLLAAVAAMALREGLRVSASAGAVAIVIAAIGAFLPLSAILRVALPPARLDEPRAGAYAIASQSHY